MLIETNGVDMLAENVKDIPGFEGIYSATEDGRVYSHSRVVKASYGSTQLRKGRWLKQKINQGRAFYNIGAKWVSAHRIIAMTFIPNPENKPQVNHIDGDPLNNHVTNLEWCTQSENIKHAYANNLKKPVRMLGTNHPRHKLSNEVVQDIKSSSESLRVLANRYGLSKTWVSKIKRNINWTHIQRCEDGDSKTTISEGVGEGSK